VRFEFRTTPVRGARDIVGYFLIWHFRDTRNSNEQGEVEKNTRGTLNLRFKNR
jgi:hypothetical protein